VLVSAPAVTIAASFTADGLERPLAFMLAAAGLDLSVRSAPYNQIFQQLLTPSGLLNANAGGVNVVLARLQDFAGEAGHAAALAERIDRVRDELADAVRQATQRSATPMIVALLPSSPELPADTARVCADAQAALQAQLAALSGVVTIAPDAIDRLCDGERFDAEAERLAHIPFSDEYLAALAIAIARRVHMLSVPARKVLVLDCDNTLWRGVVGEDGLHGIVIDEAFLAVQRFAVEAESRGILVCLASKNAEQDVIEVLEQRSEMVLKARHVVSHRINWQPKAGNLASLANELNLGLDAFVFVDDNPVECGQVREALPDVVTLQLPEEPAAIARLFANLWTFDKAAVTQEDARRTAMYRENAERDSFEAQAGDIGTFIAALEIEIEIDAPGEADWPRVAQLTHRTNQFNFTTLRRSEAEMRAAAAAGANVLAVRVRDRFGDYGLVGVVVADAVGDALAVEIFLLSCRVLGRGVEHAIVARLGALAHERGLATLRLPYRRTTKNEPARAFADSILAEHRVGDVATSFDYVVPAAVAAAVVHRPGQDATEVVEARKADGKNKPAPAAAPGVDRSRLYARLASELTSGARVQQAMHEASLRPRDLATPFVAAATARERNVVSWWESLLGVAGVGVEDDFFALGGSSLQAARLFADIARRTGVKLPMTTILEAPTPRALAARIDGGAPAPEGGLIPLKTGGSRNLFLVHDGDGETLLYRNLARLAPGDVAVFGIPPVAAGAIPLMHARIEEMAAAYVASIRARQPSGPFLLGGMCAGGLIAFEMARQLQQAGEHVERVFLLDTATPQAVPRSWRENVARDVVDQLRQERAGRSAIAALPAMAALVLRKIGRFVRFEAGQLVQLVTVSARLALTRWVVARGAAWPRAIRPLDFRTLYLAAENAYRPAATAAPPTVLMRATSGHGNDVPFRHVYEDPTFGWGAVLEQLEVHDVAGGHAGMLQEPHVASLAESMASLLAPRSREARPSRKAAHA